MSFNAKLRKLADALPQMPQVRDGKLVKFKTVALGEWHLAKNPDAKDSDGKPLEKKKQYSMEHIQYENHLKNLKNAYATGGQVAVEKYIKHVQAFQDATNSKSPNQSQ